MLTLLSLALAGPAVGVSPPDGPPADPPAATDLPPPGNEEDPQPIDPRKDPTTDPGFVPWQEVRLRKKTRSAIRAADYPKGVTADGPVRCIIRIHIDERGVPTSVEPRNCDEPFVTSARTVGMRLRFYPYEVDDVPRPVAFDLAVTFRPTERGD